MSLQNAREVVRLATVSLTFRAAFRADPAQALTLFAADLTLTGDPALGADEIASILTITDDQYTAFTHIANVLGAPLTADPQGASWAFI